MASYRSLEKGEKGERVIPTKVGIQCFQYVAKPLDSRFP